MAALLSGLLPRGLRRESYRLRRDGPTCQIFRRESYQLRRDGLTCVYVRRVSYHSVGVAFFHARTFCDCCGRPLNTAPLFSFLFDGIFRLVSISRLVEKTTNKQTNKTHTRNSMRLFQGSVVSALPGPNGSGGGGSVLQ
jgi:hypothetical protein